MPQKVRQREAEDDIHPTLTSDLYIHTMHIYLPLVTHTKISYQIMFLQQLTLTVKSCFDLIVLVKENAGEASSWKMISVVTRIRIIQLALYHQ